MKRSVLVLGIGNVLNTDEGVGVHAIRELRRALPDAAGVEMQDGGTLGLSLLPLVEEATHLLLLDAVDAGQAGGALIELEKEQIPYQGTMKLSQHQVTFQEVLGLALIRGRLPKHLHLVGIQPASLAIGVDLSPEVRAALPEMLQRVTHALSRWGVALPAAENG